ncbi:MAG: ABC-2 type transporter [Proteiniphilum acetatigenes]|uniref:ABC-2 type transporter n=1 Tax=Proteiniphilum acetatigenes TaxID=294710 RepID=A0A124FWI7_9BACT|nr:MAG: ABC-2 type transporter [Proteiniphilum acetatigenes]
MKTLATIKKEFLLLTRDPGGLMLIFLMPMVLVVVMAVIQNNTFQEFQETKLEALIVDEDQGKLSEAIARTFKALPNIQLIDKVGGNALTADEARRLVQSGKYRTAVIIPRGASDALQKKTRDTVNTLLSNYGLAEPKAPAKAKPLSPVELQYCQGTHPCCLPVRYPNVLQRLHLPDGSSPVPGNNKIPVLCLLYGRHQPKV